MSIAPGMYKFWDYDTNVFKKYCIYNEYGELVGLREDAPPDVKKAFEEYVAEEKKIREEAEKEGYLIS